MPQSVATATAAGPVSGGIASNGALAVAAIKRAGDATGVSFDFLLNMARRESGLDPSATAKTSSAAGLFQFIEQTWLGVVKQHGAEHGLADFAADINEDARGRFSVASSVRKKEILDLRFNADASARLAGELAEENRAVLEKSIGRKAGAGDLYAAHFLGATGAAKLLSADADVKAATILPKAAAANRHVFYEGGRARAVSDVIANIEKSMGQGETPSPQTAGEIPVAIPMASILQGAPHVKNWVSPNNATARADQHVVAALREGPELIRSPRRIAMPPVIETTQVVERASIGAIKPGGLSPLVLAVLQALDPTRLRSREDG